ncbi:MAG: branched-chain amino acid ABC transporter permease [Acidimicrobiales bacterium]|jgi:branched-chain amino acid transport system permease protein|nr:branched-chain amino acid ABC transporter permease [Acidimicrobiales bacterium]MDP6760901.1 branched-chain amino acid ABC transporter permease [Acidimicrobiales bacterium]|tara:strand:+ start:1413 stop:3254 length:1842 start_codon:yes stop_codon:yes gene_type:complete
MSATMNAPISGSSTAPALFDLDWRRIGTWGGLCALALILVSLIGMPVGLDRRMIIEGRLSLGYLALLWIPLLFGYVVSKRVVLEGVETPDPGARDVLAGFCTGVLSGLGPVLLILGIDNFNLREPLVNWGPPLLEQLTFGRGTGFGIVAWFGIGAVLGLLGSALHVLPKDVRRVISFVIYGLLSISVLEAVISDLSEGFGLESLTDDMYARRGGLTVKSSIILAVVIGVLPILTKGRLKGATNHYKELQGEERKRASMMLFSGVAGLCIVLPLFLGKIVNELLANVGLFLLLALGLNIVVGLAGILDLGYVAFFAVGGYTTSVLTSAESPFFAPELHFGFALIIVIIMAGLTGLVIGAPVIRMRGDYLAIVTLGFGEIIRLLFMSDWLKPYFGGAQGITNVPPVDLGFAVVTGIDPRSVFYLVLVFCTLAIYVSWRLQGSRLGRAWMAIREDEQVAEAMGINTVNAKLMAFVVGAMMAALSGAVLAAKVGSVFPNSFMILVSIIILVVVIVGGMGNIAGVLVGSFVLIGVLGGPRQPGLLQEFQSYKLLIYGALLVFMMLQRPEGLVPSARRSQELHQEEFLQDAWLKGEDHDTEEAAAAAAAGGSEGTGEQA